MGAGFRQQIQDKNAAHNQYNANNSPHIQFLVKYNPRYYRHQNNTHPWPNGIGNPNRNSFECKWQAIKRNDKAKYHNDGGNRFAKTLTTF